MLVIKKNKVSYWDVDNTLCIWDKGDKWHPHLEHIELMKQFKLQGHGIVVWSLGGWEWAAKAVKMLGIEHLVDIVIGKPDWWIDDVGADHVLTSQNEIFLKEDIKSSCRRKSKSGIDSPHAWVYFEKYGCGAEDCICKNENSNNLVDTE